MSNSSHEENKDGNYTVDVNSVDIDPIISTVVSLNGKRIEVHKNDADIAMQYIDDVTNFELDPAYEKKVLRKIDFALLPLIIGLMSCQLMDKTTNSYASIMGLQKSLNMSAKEYSWVGSSFYFGYLIFQYPANRMLQRLPLSKTLSFAVISWGIILMCHAACTNAAGFLVCRVFLGVFEGFMNPAYILLTSQWWRKEEQFMRTCIWWGMQGFGTILGAGIAYGLEVNRTGYHSFPSWKCIYIITGCITLFLGFISLIHIPDDPTKAWFLNEKDKLYVIERAKENQQGFGNQKFKWDQFKEAIIDPCTYIFFFYGMSYAIPNGGFTNFGSILLKGDFGFSTDKALLMNMPGGGIDIVFPFGVAIINYYIFNNQRLISCAIVNLIVVVGMCLLNFTKHKASKLVGYLSFYAATATSAGMCSTVSSNVAGNTKKIVVNMFYLVGYCTGNIIGPQTFQAKEAPGYSGAKAAMLVSFAVGSVLIISLYVIYYLRNKKKDKLVEEMGEKYAVPDNIAFADLTDIQNPAFRYSL
ncbi:hypothetical protein C6P40_001654 [Pichia californica]|uniref:Allantoate permease n=1 Tax=Pichia californica TaxID=460514 RepID=A0A9P7BI21_9ASCO|nr:hypothetical protein C6P42_000052 [[Candida] californica]KAG0691370.1 hypothetical protein C6P40_001654 [[Candida] californica]